MENIATKIRALIISEISGTISKNEQRFLQLLRDEYPEVRALSDYLHEVLDTVSCNESDEEIEEEIKQIIRIGNERRKVRKKKKLYLLTTMSSAAALLLTILLLTLRPFERSDKPYKALSVPQHSKPVLLSVNNKSYELHGRKLSIHKDGRITTDDSRYPGIQVKQDDRIIISNDGKYPNIQIPSNSKELALVKVPTGRMYEVELSDTTRVTINSASYIRFPINFGNTREIFVQGEARIHVAHDTSRPFWANMGDMRVRALGTVFNVNTYSPRTPKVALLSGKVEVIKGDKKVLLEQGDMATFTGQNFRVEPFDQEEMAWSTSTIFLNNADEQEVVDAFARYFDTKIVFDKRFDGREARIKLNRNLPVRTLLEQLPGGYTIEEKGNVIHLK